MGKKSFQISPNLEKLIVLIGSVMAITILTFTICYAGPGTNLQNWVTTEGKGVFLAILVIVAIFLFVKRQIVFAVIACLFAGIAGWMIYDTSGFVTFFQGIITKIFS